MTSTLHLTATRSIRTGRWTGYASVPADGFFRQITPSPADYRTAREAKAAAAAEFDARYPA
jgi:hypothetical protein